MVPVPRAASREELNAYLREECRKRRERKLWGHTETIAERFERDREKLLPLPPTPLEACELRTTRASSQALGRYETNDYSVPVEYGHRQVLVKAFVREVVIGAASEVIARHSRSCGREEMIFNPLHYLALLEQKTNAHDQAAPLQRFELPEEFIELRRKMEARLGKRGRREYVQVLRLRDVFDGRSVGRSPRSVAHPRHCLRCGEASVSVCDRVSSSEAEIWKTIRTCRGGSGADTVCRLSGVARGRPVNGHASSIVGALSEAAPPTLGAAGVSEAGRAVRQRKRHFRTVSVAPGRAGDAGSGTARHRAANQSGEVFRRVRAWKPMIF